MSVPAVDYYQILALPKDASFEDVRRAYKQKVLETHPDKLPPDSTEEERGAAREQFSKVHEASEILGDPDRRREYDIHYRELPDPSVKSATSPQSSTVSMTRSDSVSTVRTAGSRPATLRRTPSMVSISEASTRSTSKSHNDSSFSVSRPSSITSVPSTAPSAKALSRTNSVVTAPPVARTNTISSSHSHSANDLPSPVSRSNSVVTTPQPVARTNTISSSHSHSANDLPSPVSRSNSSASTRQTQGTVSRSNSSATVRGAPTSVSRSGTISSDHQFPSPLSRTPSTSSNRESRALPSISRTNSIATVRSFPASTASSEHLPQPVSRSNSTVTAPPPASVSRSNSIAAVTAISLNDPSSSSILRSNSSATALTTVSARSKAVSNYSDRISMATVTSAFRDLPTPPYSQPKDYDALVGAMLQELYRLNPEWVERKKRLQEIKAQREAGNKIDSQFWRASLAS